MIKLLAAAAFAAAQTAPATETAPAKCLPKQGIGDAAMVMSPFLVEGIARKCATHLPATAFLNANGAALAERLRADSAGRVPSAIGVMRIVAGDKLPPVQDEAGLVKVAGEMMAVMVGEKLDPKMCPELSRMTESVAPLPSANLGMFASAFAGLIGASGGVGKGPGICPE